MNAQIIEVGIVGLDDDGNVELKIRIRDGAVTTEITAAAEARQFFTSAAALHRSWSGQDVYPAVDFLPAGDRR